MLWIVLHFMILGIMLIEYAGYLSKKGLSFKSFQLPAGLLRPDAATVSCFPSSI